jgi:hypothetical protein
LLIKLHIERLPPIVNMEGNVPPSYEQLMHEITELRAFIQEQHDVQQAYQAQQQAAASSRPTATENTPATEAPSYDQFLRTAKPRFPNPSKYSHENPSEYISFRMNLKSKLLIDRATFLSDDEKVCYAFDRLSGVAAKRMTPWIRTNQDNGTISVASFFTEMDSAFDDPQRQEKALVRVNSMKQGGRDLIAFLGEFNETLVDAGGLSWDDSQKKTLLQVAINVRLMEAMVGRDKKPTYEGYCDQLRAVDEDLKQIRRIQGRGQPPRTSRPITGNKREPEQMDWQPTQVNALRTKEREYWGSPEEIAQRRKEGLCLRCGRKGHLVRGCSGPISRKPMKMAATKQVAIIDEVDNDYSSDSSVESQGKE